MTQPKTDDDVTLLERADEAFAEGRPDEALQLYVPLLESDPENDLYVWYRTALLLGRLGDHQEALRSLDLVAARLAESGQLLLALAAVKEMESLASGSAAERLGAVASLYGSGSPHIDAGQRRAPPPPPARIDVVPGGDLTDPRILREMAQQACITAVQHWSDRPMERSAKVPYHPLLSDLSPEDLATITLEAMQLKVLPASEVVIEQDTEGTSFFILARGQVQVSRRPSDPEGEEVHLATLRTGSFFGEMALLTAAPRAARVVCERPVILFELDREGVEQLACRSSRVAEVLGRYTKERLLRNLVATSPLFAPLDQSRQESLIGLFETILLEPGQVVVDEGQSSEELFVVLSGAVQVSKKDAQGEELTLAELEAGQIFGEISLIQKRPATATVRAIVKTVLLSLSRQSFNEHVADYPEVLTHIYRVATEREEANLQLEKGDFVAVDEDLLLI
jgi:cAMP-dependent protein kinase regulator